MDSVYIGLYIFIVYLAKGDGIKNSRPAITTVNEQDPLCIFKYALKAAESQRQYPRRLKVYLDYLGLKGGIHNQAREFAQEG